MVHGAGRGPLSWIMALVLASICVDPAGAQESLSEPVQAEAGIDAESDIDAEREVVPPPDELPPAPDGANAVQLDQLLKLPNTLDFREERKGGAGASDWRRRFREGEERIENARDRLAQVEGELEQAAGSGGTQWQIAPPGQQASAETGPLSFRLREELRRARANLDESESQYRALMIEADLAGVPEGWRQATR